MKKQYWLKQAFTVMLSLSVTLGPCAPGSFSVYADTAAVEADADAVEMNDTGAEEYESDNESEEVSEDGGVSQEVLEESDADQEVSEESDADQEENSSGTGESSAEEETGGGESPGAAEDTDSVQSTGEETDTAESWTEANDPETKETEPPSEEQTEIREESKNDDTDVSEDIIPAEQSSEVLIPENDFDEETEMPVQEEFVDDDRTEAGAESGKDWYVLQSEVEGTVLSVVYEEGVLPDHCILEVLKTEEDSSEHEEFIEKVRTAVKPVSEMAASVFEIHISDLSGNELEPDMEKGKIYIKFEALRSPAEVYDEDLAWNSVRLFGSNDLQEEKVRELRIIDLKDIVPAEGAATEENMAAEGVVINDITNIPGLAARLDDNKYVIAVWTLDNNDIHLQAEMMDAAPVAASTDIPLITDSDGQQYHIDDFDTKYVALFFGTTSCDNTAAMLRLTRTMISQRGISLQPVLMDLDKDIQARRNYETNNPDVLVSWGTDHAAQVTKLRKSSGGFTMPYLVIYEDGNAVYESTGYSGSQLTDFFQSSAIMECLTAGYRGVYYTETADTILNRINEIRREACSEGIEYQPGKKLTMSNYKELRWSSDLETIARQRAAEACVNMSHTRPDNSSPADISSGGITTQGENLAWHPYSKEALMYGIEQWYEEKEDLLSGSRGTAGHYLALIDPSCNYIGIGAFQLNGGYFCTTAAEFSARTGLNEKKNNSAGETTVSISVPVVYTKLKIKGSSIVSLGKTETLSAVYEVTLQDSYGNDLMNQAVPLGKVLWSSSDTSVASVNQNGVVTPVQKGTATISVSAENGKMMSSVSLRVQDPDQIEAFVRRLYKGCFGRDADTGGLEYWVESLKAHRSTGAAAGMFFFESNEMKNMNLSSNEFINRLYTVMMDRHADQGGRNYWLECLNNGMSKTWLIKQFIDSSEFTGICEKYGITKGSVNTKENRDRNYGVTSFIARIYTKALGRSFDVNGLNYWTSSILTAKDKKKQMISAAMSFLDSEEFRNKNLDDTEYVKVLYRTFFGREYDASGLSHWVTNIEEKNITRDGVLKSFAYSKEFAALMAQYGIK